MLRRDPEAPKAPTWVAKIEEGARRLERIVRDLLAFARPGERELPVAKTLGEWLLEARAEAGETRLAIESGDASVPVRGSPRALGKVFANLIRNAREAGAQHVSVRVEALPGQRVSVLVEDDGAGIDEKVRDRLFDPFVGTKEDGSGLGLAFCARALETMHGSIRLRPGLAGTCFEIELPGGRE
jgi:signal transduction histidine kinase